MRKLAPFNSLTVITLIIAFSVVACGDTYHEAASAEQHISPAPESTRGFSVREDLVLNDAIVRNQIPALIQSPPVCSGQSCCGEAAVWTGTVCLGARLGGYLHIQNGAPSPMLMVGRNSSLEFTMRVKARGGQDKIIQSLRFRTGEGFDRAELLIDGFTIASCSVQNGQCEFTGTQILLAANEEKDWIIRLFTEEEALFGAHYSLSLLQVGSQGGTDGNRSEQTEGFYDQPFAVVDQP